MVFSDITRKQAFLTHLAISVCIFVIFSYLIGFYWFPEFYFYLDGGIRAITIFFIVSVILGPSLTLLVFKPGKKMLKFDMVVILLLHMSALIWGINNIYAERSGSAVFYWGKFSCLSHNETGDMDMTAIAAGPSGRQNLSFLQRPDTAEDFHRLVTEAFKNNSTEIHYYGEKITALDGKVVTRLKNYQLNLSKLAEESEVTAKHVVAYLDRHTDDIEHVKLIPLSCRFGSVIAVYDTRELKITDWFGMVRTSVRAEALDGPLRFKSPQDVDEGNKPGNLEWAI